MTALLFKLLGGVGLFLLGMVLLTDGLKAFAGEALRRVLVRFTGTPVKAFASGAVTTLLVQSSSATTVAVIGFVSAGLLAFPQAVGVVMGASLGTTGTSWIVALLGLKISVGFYALPLVGVGAFMKLLAQPRWQPLGLALAGFGLIFLGIEALQDGMRGLSSVFDLAALPARGFGGHLILLLIGIALTVLMQSSSAAVATTLTALHTGSINFEQASSLVIGAAIGTTVTGALAAIGGTVPAKRTALAHVLFNAGTGLLAVLLLPVFLPGIGWAQANLGLDPGATSLAAFHTAFITLGVVVFLPWVRPFSGWIERLLPERGPALTQHLDATVLTVPAVALETARRALRETAGVLFGLFAARTDGTLTRQQELQTTEVAQALDQIQRFVTAIPSAAADGALSPLRVAQLHAIDHLTRLQAVIHPAAATARRLDAKALREARASCLALLQLGGSGLRGQETGDWIERMEEGARNLSESRRRERPLIMEQAVSGGRDARETLEVLDAMRWLDTVGYHAWRISYYLGQESNSRQATPAEEMDAARREPGMEPPAAQLSQRP